MNTVSSENIKFVEQPEEVIKEIGQNLALLFLIDTTEVLQYGLGTQDQFKELKINLGAKLVGLSDEIKLLPRTEIIEILSGLADTELFGITLSENQSVRLAVSKLRQDPRLQQGVNALNLVTQIQEFILKCLPLDNSPIEDETSELHRIEAMLAELSQALNYGINHVTEHIKALIIKRLEASAPNNHALIELVQMSIETSSNEVLELYLNVRPLLRSLDERVNRIGISDPSDKVIDKLGIHSIEELTRVLARHTINDIATYNPPAVSKNRLMSEAGDPEQSMFVLDPEEMLLMKLEVHTDDLLAIIHSEEIDYNEEARIEDTLTKYVGELVKYAAEDLNMYQKYKYVIKALKNYLNSINDLYAFTALQQERFNMLIDRISLRNLASGYYKMFDEDAELIINDYGEYELHADSGVDKVVLKPGKAVHEIVLNSINKSDVEILQPQDIVKETLDSFDINRGDIAEFANNTMIFPGQGDYQELLRAANYTIGYNNIRMLYID